MRRAKSPSYWPEPHPGNPSQVDFRSDFSGGARVTIRRVPASASAGVGVLAAGRRRLPAAEGGTSLPRAFRHAGRMRAGLLHCTSSRDDRASVLAPRRRDPCHDLVRCPAAPRRHPRRAEPSPGGARCRSRSPQPPGPGDPGASGGPGRRVALGMRTRGEIRPPQSEGARRVASAAIESGVAGRDSSVSGSPPAPRPRSPLPNRHAEVTHCPGLRQPRAVSQPSRAARRRSSGSWTLRRSPAVRRMTPSGADLRAPDPPRRGATPAGSGSGGETRIGTSRGERGRSLGLDQGPRFGARGGHHWEREPPGPLPLLAGGEGSS